MALNDKFICSKLIVFEARSCGFAVRSSKALFLVLFVDVLKDVSVLCKNITKTNRFYLIVFTRYAFYVFFFCSSVISFLK